jgi:hypothetical protein
MGSNSWVTSPLNWSSTNAMSVTPSKEGTACTNLESTILTTPAAPQTHRTEKRSTNHANSKLRQAITAGFLEQKDSGDARSPWHPDADRF